MINEPFIKALEEPENIEAKKEYEMIMKSKEQPSFAVNPLDAVGDRTLTPRSIQRQSSSHGNQEVNQDQEPNINEWK